MNIQLIFKDKKVINMTIKFIKACVILALFGTIQISAKYNALTRSSKAPAKPVYPYPHLLVKNMDEEQLEKTLEYGKHELIQDKDLVFKVFFHLISQSKSQEKIKIYKLDFADYLFNIKDYEKSLMAYEEFSMLYPGCAESEYVMYKGILCNFLLSLDFDRDQTLTQRTVSAAMLFLQKVKDEKFKTETQNIYNACRQRLFDHEVYVLETYLKLKKFSSARKRIEFIEQNFKDIANLDKYLSYCTEMVKIVENPKTRPFMIQLNLDHAVKDKKDLVAPARKAHGASFFLA